MLVCYLDDSGEKNEPVSTIAGYITPVDQWLEFEREAGKFFDAIELEYLHTVDLHHLRNEFDGWTREQALEFSKFFHEMVSRHVALGFECSIAKPIFEGKKSQYGVGSQTSALAMGFTILVDRIIKHEGVASVLGEPGVNISFVIESGNNNNVNVLETFNAIQRQNPELFKSLIFKDKKSRIALQAADFLAYYSRRLRNKQRSHKRYDDEFRFFRASTGAIQINHFFAVDFGV